MEKRVVLDRIEIEASGALFVKLQKQIVDGDAVIWSEPHRCAFDLTNPIPEQIAVHNQALAQMTRADGTPFAFPAISDDVVKQISSHASLAATPKLVAMLEARRAERIVAEIQARRAESAAQALI